MITLLVIILIAMSSSFVCSLIEACVLSLSLTDVAHISEKKPFIAKIWNRFKDNIERPIAVILIIDTLSHTIGAALAGSHFDTLFGPRWIPVFALVFSFAMIQWTDILPKSLGVQYNKRIAVMIALPLKILVSLFTPVITIVEWINRPFIRQQKQTGEGYNAVSEISVLARFATLHNVISKDQEKILSRTINLSKMSVKDVMISKNDIKYLSSQMSLSEALIVAHIHHHTRFPLVEGEQFEHILGYVNFKDIVSALQMNPQNPSLQGICRPILFISENEPVAPLLNRLIKGYHHIALVKDAAGNAVGLITLEDVIEAIIGDVSDEYDVLPCHFYQISPSRYIVGGGLSVQALSERLNITIASEAKNVSEWLIDLFGRTPKTEEKISRAGHTFIMRKISRASIHEVIVDVDPVKENAPA